MKHAHVVRRRKEVADSGAAVGEGKRVLTVYPLFSLQAGGAKRKAHKRETPLPGRCPKPRHLLKKVDENFFSAASPRGSRSATANLDPSKSAPTNNEARARSAPQEKGELWQKGLGDFLLLNACYDIFHKEPSI